MKPGSREGREVSGGVGAALVVAALLGGCRGDAPQIAAVPEPTTSALVPGAPNAENAGAEPVPHTLPGAKTVVPKAPPHEVVPPPNMKVPPSSTSL